MQTDGGGEFFPSRKLNASSGIFYRQTCPLTHHQNGSVERRLRQIVDIGLALLSHSHVPFRYWHDAFDTACYLINHLPAIATRPHTPFELLFHKSLNYRLLKTFGCECWPYLRPYNSHKFSLRSKSCVFLGYSKPRSGYKCLDISSGRLYIARHVICNETTFSFHTVLPPTAPLPLLPSTSLPSNLRLPALIPSAPHDVTTAPHVLPTAPTDISTAPAPPIPHPPASSLEPSPSSTGPSTTHPMTT